MLNSINFEVKHKIGSICECLNRYSLIIHKELTSKGQLFLKLPKRSLILSDQIVYSTLVTI
ncbi:MAG: hypothetical protein H6605_01890 [Flavobacteriales bacterium]|nr:hypothetical protein [Flavobacteriales bacterium]